MFIVFLSCMAYFLSCYFEILEWCTFIYSSLNTLIKKNPVMPNSQFRTISFERHECPFFPMAEFPGISNLDMRWCESLYRLQFVESWYYTFTTDHDHSLSHYSDFEARLNEVWYVVLRCNTILQDNHDWKNNCRFHDQHNYNE